MGDRRQEGRRDGTKPSEPPQRSQPRPAERSRTTPSRQRPAEGRERRHRARHRPDLRARGTRTAPEPQTDSGGRAQRLRAEARPAPPPPRAPREARERHAAPRSSGGCRLRRSRSRLPPPGPPPRDDSVRGPETGAAGTARVQTARPRLDGTAALSAQPSPAALTHRGSPGGRSSGDGSEQRRPQYGGGSGRAGSERPTAAERNRAAPNAEATPLSGGGGGAMRGGGAEPHRPRANLVAVRVSRAPSPPDPRSRQPQPELTAPSPELTLPRSPSPGRPPGLAEPGAGGPETPGQPLGANSCTATRGSVTQRGQQARKRCRMSFLYKVHKGSASLAAPGPRGAAESGAAWPAVPSHGNEDINGDVGQRQAVVRGASPQLSAGRAG